MPKPLFWTKKSILLLTVPFLMFETLVEVLLAPRALMLENALLVRVAEFILTLVLCLASIVGGTSCLGRLLWWLAIFDL